jgi:hypothetical protein
MAKDSIKIDSSVLTSYSKADWRQVVRLYQQFRSIVNDPEKENVLPNIITGSLAQSLGRVLAYYDGQEQGFMNDLFCILCKLEKYKGSQSDSFRRLYYDNRLDRFTEYNPSENDRRRPKPFEASIETCRRLINLNLVRDVLVSIPSGGILGGSLSYGRFFNVIGASRGKSSDIDLLLILPTYEYLFKVSSALKKVQGLEKESLEYFRERINLFRKIRKSYPNCIFSHKLKFWENRLDPYLSQYQIPGHFLLSIHICSWSEFEFIIIKDKPILEPNPDGKFQRDIFDYRDTEPTRLDNQRSFAGIDFTIQLQTESVKHGFVSRVRVCHIEKDESCPGERYYPGLHQNLILPQFEIRWQAPSLRLYLPVLAFRWKILERLREERRQRPFEIQSLSLSHTRSAVFSPHITRRADRE